MILDTSKNGRWIILFKKFNRLMVKGKIGVNFFRDNVVWDEEQEKQARTKTEEQLANPASKEDIGTCIERITYCQT